MCISVGFVKNGKAGGWKGIRNPATRVLFLGGVAQGTTLHVKPTVEALVAKRLGAVVLAEAGAKARHGEVGIVSEQPLFTEAMARSRELR